jgi:glycerol-3-phosphate cytidylyltransferase
MKTVITFGTYDLFHIGHLRLLQRARQLGDRLVVGVSTDELNFSKKGFRPIFPHADRMAIVAAMAGVDQVFAEESLDLKGEYIKTHKADILVMGDDWKGKFDHFADLCQVVYLPRTAGISTTQVKLETFRQALR